MKWIEKSAHSIEKIGMNKGLADRFAMMLATSLGGWAMVAPTWVAEHFRKPLVAKLNEGEPTPDANHPPKEIPQQTVGTLVRGRILAMITVTASFWAAEHFFRDQFKAFENFVGDKAVTWFGKGKTEKQITKIHRYGEISALDVFATTAATILLYAGSRFFAREREQKHERIAAQHTAHRDMAGHAPDAVSYDQQPAAAPATTVDGAKARDGMVLDHAPEQAAQLS